MTVGCGASVGGNCCFCCCTGISSALPKSVSMSSTVEVGIDSNGANVDTLVDTDETAIS